MFSTSQYAESQVLQTSLFWLGIAALLSPHITQWWACPLGLADLLKLITFWYRNASESSFSSVHLYCRIVSSSTRVLCPYFTIESSSIGTAGRPNFTARQYKQFLLLRTQFTGVPRLYYIIWTSRLAKPSIPTPISTTVTVPLKLRHPGSGGIVSLRPLLRLQGFKVDLPFTEALELLAL